MGKPFDSMDEWFNGNPYKTKKSKGASGGGGVLKPKKRPRHPNSTNNITNGIKAITNNVTNGSSGGGRGASHGSSSGRSSSGGGRGATGSKSKPLPQVMVKISGGSKGCDKTQAHVSYIGRNGEVEVEDEQGNKYLGKDQKTLLKAWEAMGVNAEDEKGKRKESFNFVFSMPNGTDPERLKIAVRNLIHEEFAGHKYFMAQHLDTDSPHCHVVLCASDDRGARLNPRKADLHNYRVAFVNKLAEQGIQATASRRVHHFKHKSNERQGVYHRNRKLGITKNPPTSEQVEKIEQTQKTVEMIYQEALHDPATPPEVKKSIQEMLEAKNGQQIDTNTASGLPNFKKGKSVDYGKGR